MGRQLERGSGSNNSIDKILFCLSFLYERENPSAVANFRMKLQHCVLVHYNVVCYITWVISCRLT